MAGGALFLEITLLCSMALMSSEHLPLFWTSLAEGITGTLGLEVSLEMSLMGEAGLCFALTIGVVKLFSMKCCWILATIKSSSFDRGERAAGSPLD